MRMPSLQQLSLRGQIDAFAGHLRGGWGLICLYVLVLPRALVWRPEADIRHLSLSLASVLRQSLTEHGTHPVI